MSEENSSTKSSSIIVATEKRDQPPVVETQAKISVQQPFSKISKSRIKFILFIVTIAGFLGPLSGNIYIAILPSLANVFDVSIKTINATVSVFMAIFSVGPLLWASCADYSGRKTLYVASLALFELSSVLLSTLPPNIAALFILRVVQAFGASSFMSVGAGTVSDLVPPRDRGKAISFFMLGPQLGPIIGPIFSVATANNKWRWCFIVPAIIGAVVSIFILFGYPETLRCLVGDGECYEGKSWIVKPKLTQKKIIEDNARFPQPPKPSLKGYVHLLKYKPVLLCSVNAGLLFASFYAISVTFTEVLHTEYGFTEKQRSLSYICLGVSMIAGSIISGYASDYTRKRIEKTHEYIPEQRFTIQLFGAILSMGGLLGYGWGVEKHVHVAAIFVFTAISGFGMTWVFTTTTTYLTECATGQPATNVAIGNFMRNTAAAISSGIIAILVRAMGYGWCFTGLALVNLFGIAIIILLIVKGRNWRLSYQRSQKHENLK